VGVPPVPLPPGAALMGVVPIGAGVAGPLGVVVGGALVEEQPATSDRANAPSAKRDLPIRGKGDIAALPVKDTQNSDTQLLGYRLQSTPSQNIGINVGIAETKLYI
jgi:hypothetical protein